MEDSREYFKTQRSFKVLDSLTGNKKHSEKAGYEERAPGAMNSVNFKNKKTWKKKKRWLSFLLLLNLLRKQQPIGLKYFCFRKRRAGSWVPTVDSSQISSAEGLKGRSLRVEGGGTPVLKRLACHSLLNFGINHLWLGWLCVDGMTARKAGGSERKGEIKCTIVCLDTLEQSGIYCTSSTA